jgi:hypothetical protein
VGRPDERDPSGRPETISGKLQQSGGEALVIESKNALARHSRAGGNPARANIPQSGQSHDVVPLRGRFFNHLDSRLRGNDAVFANGIFELNTTKLTETLNMSRLVLIHFRKERCHGRSHFGYQTVG